MRRLLPVLPCLLALTLPAPALEQDGAPWWWEEDGTGEGEAAQPAPEPAPVVPEPAHVEDAWVLPAEPLPAPPPAPAPAPVEVGPPLVTSATVPGSIARLRTDGRAAIPRGAPKRVRAIIAAANQIVGKPYKWGGGHARLVDRGYDCSGTVSYALIRAGLLGGPLVSGGFKRYGSAGAGRWVSIYANNGHVYMEVAGLRLDTSALADPRGGKGPRWRPAIGRRDRFKVRHPAGL